MWGSGVSPPATIEGAKPPRRLLPPPGGYFSGENPLLAAPKKLLSRPPGVKIFPPAGCFRASGKWGREPSVSLPNPPGGGPPLLRIIPPLGEKKICLSGTPNRGAAFPPLAFPSRRKKEALFRGPAPKKLKSGRGKKDFLQNPPGLGRPPNFSTRPVGFPPFPPTKIPVGRCPASPRKEPQRFGPGELAARNFGNARKTSNCPGFKKSPNIGPPRGRLQS